MATGPTSPGVAFITGIRRATKTSSLGQKLLSLPFAVELYLSFDVGSFICAIFGSFSLPMFRDKSALKLTCVILSLLIIGFIWYIWPLLITRLLLEEPICPARMLKGTNTEFAG